MADVIDFNEEHLAFYYELGIAITQWASVEFSLSWLVSTGFTKGGWNAATSGFMSIDNIRSKLAFVETVLTADPLSEYEAATWATLRDRTESASKKRNALAHGWVFNDLSMKPGRRVMILPRRPAKGAARQKYPGAICLRDVVSYRLEFVALMRALENFHAYLIVRPSPYPESQEQPERPPILANLRREIYAYAQRPPRPSRR